MVTSEKIELVSGLTEKLRGAQSIVLTDFKGMTVAQMTALRNELRTQAIEIKVYKNRLLRIALAEAGCDALDEFLVGNTAVAFGLNDPAAPAKVLLKFAKDNNKLVIKGGLLEKRRLNEAGVTTLSKMPGRKDLLSMIARDFKAPAAKVATVFSASLTKLAYAMKALADKKTASA
jgi:large subunit ribosomal protein L10